MCPTRIIAACACLVATAIANAQDPSICEAHENGDALDFWIGDWEQIWVTTDTSRPGGLKHKELVKHLDDGGSNWLATFDAIYVRTGNGA